MCIRDRRSQVLGTGVWLDTTRLRRLLAQELNIGAQRDVYKRQV